MPKAEGVPETAVMSPAAFRAWRRAAGLTQVQAAERLGLKRRMVQYYETGTRGGFAVEVPRSVRLACWAISTGVLDYDGQEPVRTGDRAAPE